MDFPKKYKSAEIEEKWKQYWKENQIFKWDQNVKTREESFVIDTPPPTVSGLLHMGHIFSYTQADFIARYQRMSGKNVFYPMGFDDNGLPTERLVEKVKKIKGKLSEREEFIKICQEVVKDAEEDFRNLFQTIALSVDWSQEYQTISKQSRHISQLSFLDLYQKDKLYRKLQPTFWDPVDATALAQADIIDRDFKSYMNEIIFKIDGIDVGDNNNAKDENNHSQREIVIATTRPELLAACVAVFIHPDDERAKDLVGKNAITPLFGVKVPIIADDMVDMAKGTGLVMCCTFGDQTDIKWWQKYNLNLKSILDKQGRLCNLDKIGQQKNYESVSNKDVLQSLVNELTGLTVKKARIKIIELLLQDKILIKQVEIEHTVKCAERSGAPLEILVTPQWFIKILDEKENLLQKSKECNWYPSHMRNRIEQWIEGLSWDWCISRQRFFGVPFPVWYSKRDGEEGKVIVANKESLPIDPIKDLPEGYNKDEVIAEVDVMDTWATSSVSPQLSSHAISKDFAIDYERHQKLFPADLRPQAHEIIRTWAFYAITKAYLHEEKLPWKNIMISGWCLASDKTKMSKSKGNVITPESLIREKSADIVRFWASTSYLGVDTAYSESLLLIGKKLTTKLWNASKFVNLQIVDIIQKDEKRNLITSNQEYLETILLKNKIVTEALDLWILARLNIVIKNVTEFFNKFEYAKAREVIEDFFWKDFCDNYLEYVKTRSYGDLDYIQKLYGDFLENIDCNAENIQQLKSSATYSLYYILNIVLRLFAPFIPYITEEIYSIIYTNCYHNQNSMNSQNKSIHSQNMWPIEFSLKKYENNCDYLALGEAVREVVDEVRKYKSDHELSLKVRIGELEIYVSSDIQKEYLSQAKFDLCNVLNVQNLKITVDNGASQMIKKISIDRTD